MKRTGPTNIQLRKLITLLKKQDRAIWKRVAADLNKPARKRREVDLSRINRYVKENEIAIVPGVVLGDGSIDHKITVVAFKFSKSAKEKILKAGGKVYTLKEFIGKNADAKGVKLIG